MPAILLDGKALSAELKDDILTRAHILTEGGVCPSLAVVSVGADDASAVYTGSIMRKCTACGIKAEHFALEQSCGTEQLISLIKRLNDDNSVHGILLQTPLPAHIDAAAACAAIAPQKDIDAANPLSLGRLASGNYDFAPCTPLGVTFLLDRYKINACGKHCVIIGRSNIVGKPMAMLLLASHGTITVCHSRTPDLGSIARQADILVAAVGRAEFITGDMIKDGAVVIDVGINRNAQGALCGDVNFAQAAQKASYITPVPGGVGALTVTALMSNVIKAAEKYGTHA